MGSEHVDVVGVGDVALVCDAGDFAEALLEALGELVSGGFQGSAVEAEVDVVLLLPFGAGVVHMLHDRQGKGGGLSVGVGVAGHVLYALTQPGVAQGDGGVSAVQELVNGLALLEAGAMRRTATKWAQHRRGCP